MLQILTATGARPEAWRLCERYMRRQDYEGPVRWIIVDDGEHPQLCGFERAGWCLEWVRPLPRWAPGDNTQARNVLAGLALVDPVAPLVIVEDDDWYAADWLTTCARELRDAELVGEMCSRYYNVATRVARPLTNRSHASLCSTALRGPAVAVLRDCCRSREKFLDLALWRARGPRKRLFNGGRVVGIKGLPGRAGIGIGHRATFQGLPDAAGKILRNWIGADAGGYL
jgi:hypothetical protein